MNQKKTQMGTIAMRQFVDIFRQPGSEMYPVPWWAWNGSLEFEEMTRQIELMHDQGIYEFFIFALIGLEKPHFLSSQWFEYISFTISEAEKRGMKLWIYDDLNWPSGSAGGYAVKEHPEKREFVLRYSETRLEPGDYLPVNPVGALSFQWRCSDGEIIPAELDTFGCFRNSSNTPGELLIIRLTPSSRILLNSTGTAASWGQRGQIDLLSRDGFQLWMSYIYGEYDRRFHEYFG